MFALKYALDEALDACRVMNLVDFKGAFLAIALEVVDTHEADANFDKGHKLGFQDLDFNLFHSLVVYLVVAAYTSGIIVRKTLTVGSILPALRTVSRT